MVSEIIDISLDLFEQDCQQLKALDYPTIHNKGFLEFHLTKTLSRRIQDACYNANIPANRTQLREDISRDFLPIYKINMLNTQSNKNADIWIIGEHLISAGNPSREQIFKHLDYFFNVLYKEQGEERYLLLVCDHWFDRNHSSKTLPAWWLGRTPDAIEEYKQAGMHLRASDTSLIDKLKHKYDLCNGEHRLRHPLHKMNGKTNVLKYMLFTAVYSI